MLAYKNDTDVSKSREIRVQPQPYRCVHLFPSFVRVFKGLLCAASLLFTTANRDAFLIEVVCAFPVSVIVHPATM